MTRRCRLCGASTSDVHPGWVRWRRETTDGPLFEAIDRCRDAVACRDRVLAIGEAWNVADGQASLGNPERVTA